MKRGRVLLIFGIFVVVFLINEISALNINVNSPLDGQVFTLGHNELGKYISVNISTDEEANCFVIPGICQDDEEMIGTCLYFSSQDLSTLDNKNYFDNIFIQKYSGYPKQDLYFECKDKLNQTSSKDIYFYLNYTTPNENQISCGDTIYNDTILDKDLLDCQTIAPFNAITIGADNITFDCNSHWITGDILNYPDGSYSMQNSGIYLNNKKGVTIKNCYITNFSQAIMLEFSNQNTLSNNNLLKTSGGGWSSLKLLSSSDNKIVENTLEDQAYFESSQDNIIKNNIFKGSEIYSISSFNSQIKNNKFFNSDIDIRDSSGNLLINNTLTQGGIYLIFISNTIIEDNLIENNLWDGIHLYNSSYNSIKKNTIKNSSYLGIELFYFSSYNEILENLLYNKGILESYSENNTYCINGTGNYYFDGATGPVCEVIIKDKDKDGFCEEGYLIKDASIECNKEKGQYGSDCNDNNPKILPPYDEMIITQNTTFCKGDYSLPKGIIIGSDNLVLDCNKSLLRGSFIGYDGIGVRNFSNVIIKNCKITDGYAVGIFVQNSNNIKLYNNEVYSSIQWNVYLYQVSNSNVYNNLIYSGEYGIILDNSYDNSIFNNSIYNNSDVGIPILESDNNIINNNNIYSNKYGISIEIHGINNNIYYNNIFNNSDYEIYNSQKYDSNLSYNYLGNLNISMISKKIYGLGLGSYIPFLCESYPTNWISDLNGNCNNSTNTTFNLLINSPKNMVYDKTSIIFNLTANGSFNEIAYIDWNEVRPRWNTLCRNCNEYGSKRKITKSFREGQHNLSFRAINGIKNEILNVSFFVDSKDPQISITKPQSRKYTNGSNFYIRYTENNCK